GQPLRRRRADRTLDPVGPRAVVGDDARDDLEEARAGLVPDDGDLAYAAHGRDHRLDVGRQNPLAAHLEEVVAATEDAERPVGAPHRAIARRVPLALEGAPGRVDPPPVALGEAAAADAHHADLAVRGRRAVVRLEPHLVAGRRHTDRAGDDPTASVRAIDVEHLR